MFHPDINDARWWYVIQVSPRGKAIYEGQDVDLMVEVAVDDVNIEEEGAQDDGTNEAPPILENVVHQEDINAQVDHNINGDDEVDNDEDDVHDDDDDDDDDDDESIGMNLFIDLASMGLEVDQDTCTYIFDDSRDL